MTKIFFFFLLIIASASLRGNPSELPTFGDRLSGTLSIEKERQLGQQFLRSLRAQAPILDDPILQDYLEHLIYRLAAHSELSDKRLDLVLIKNKNINAFAAPGGIIGLHHGLFLYGETEHELSAILAHELAHLSQRHFARRLDESKKNSVISLAGFLASIILAATASGDAAMAAITSTQGIAQSKTLRYSRDREAEADRVGIQTLALAGMDPRAMALMFERLQKSSRYTRANEIPEFLRTHPVTKSRIADSYNQAMRYSDERPSLRLNYQLMRSRVRALTTIDSSEELKRFQILAKSPVHEIEIAGKYGLVLINTKENQKSKALTTLRELIKRYPLNINFRIAEADIYAGSEELEMSQKILEKALDTSPGNYPLTVKYAEILLASGKAELAIKTLHPLSATRSSDLFVWYLLAESYGLAKNIPALH